MKVTVVHQSVFCILCEWDCGVR